MHMFLVQGSLHLWFFFSWFRHKSRGKLFMPDRVKVFHRKQDPLYHKRVSLYILQLKMIFKKKKPQWAARIKIDNDNIYRWNIWHFSWVALLLPYPDECRAPVWNMLLRQERLSWLLSKGEYLCYNCCGRVLQYYEDITEAVWRWSTGM